MAKLILSMDGMVLKEIALTKERTTIGRKPHNDIQIDNLAVSGEHAVIVTILSDSFLEDLGSTNGTLVNGQPIKKHFLQNNDAIELGKYRLKYANEAATSPKNPEFERTMLLNRGPGAAPEVPGPHSGPRPVTGSHPMAQFGAAQFGAAGFGGASFGSGESVPGVSESQPLAASSMPIPPGPIPPILITGPQPLPGTGAAHPTPLQGMPVLDRAILSARSTQSNETSSPFAAMDFVPVRQPTGTHSLPSSGPQSLSGLGIEPLLVEPRAAKPLTATGVIQILTGSNAGRELELVKPLTTLGKPQVQVAVITKRPNGYYITHVEGINHPIVNGRALDSQATLLHDHDVIEIAGVKMEFYLKD